MQTVWQWASDITPEIYLEHLARRSFPACCSDVYREFPVLELYDRAFERIVSELKGNTAAPDACELYLLYNMGYVVKTARGCFGVDLHHRLASHFADKLDFLCITHNHDDHYEMSALQAFEAAGKMIISNFYPAAGYSKYKKEHCLANGIRVIAHESDHNIRLQGFTAPMEIILENGIVLYFGGDSYRADQLIPDSGRADCLILHPRVGLAPQEAVRAVKPDLTLVSHLLEFHHPVDKWRWSYEDGLEALSEIASAGFCGCIPFWGEKVTITGHSPEK